MQRYNKYIIMRLIGPIFFIGGSLTGIIWLTQSLRFIDMIINQGISVLTFIHISMFLLPSLIGTILPIATFIGVVFVYNRLMMDSELIILENAGISRAGIAKPAITVAIIATMIGYFISLYLMPASFREFKDMQSFLRNNYSSLLLQDGVFNTPIKGLTIYIKEREGNGLLKGIIVHDERVPEKPVTMMAEEGSLIQTASGPRFILNNGSRQEVDYKNSNVTVLYFDSYAIDISLYSKNEGPRWREPQERFLNELFNPEDTTPPQFLPKLRAEAHSRITWPMLNIALTFMALTIFLTGDLNRRGRWQKILITSIAAFAFLALAVALNNIVARRPSLTPLMYINVGFIISLSVYILSPRIRKTMNKAVS